MSLTRSAPLIPERLLLLLAAAGGVAVAAVAVRVGVLPAVAAIGTFLLLLAVGVRSPVIPLLAYAALIPVENALVVPQLGTLARYAGAAFVLSHVIWARGRVDLRVLSPWVWAYVAWAAASIAWAVDRGVAMTAALTLVQMAVVALLAADLVRRDASVAWKVLAAFSVTAIGDALLAVANFISDPGPFGRRGAFAEQQVNKLALVLIPAFLLLVDRTSRSRSSRPALAAFAAGSIATALGMLVSGTRGAWVGVLVGLAVLFWSRFSRRALAGVVVAALAIALLIAVVPGLADSVATRIARAGAGDLSGRAYIWRVTGEIYLRHPVLGVGHDNLPAAWTPEIAREATGIENPRYTDRGWGAHNFLLGTLAELGPVGLLFVILVTTAALRAPPGGPDGTLLRAILVALVVHGLVFDQIYATKTVWLVLALAFGLRAAAGQLTLRSESAAPSPPA